MSARRSPPVVHDSFTLERTYDASPARVFAAWSDAETKARWFVGPEGWSALERRHDFRVGGEDVLRGRSTEGWESLYTARYLDIVPDERIVLVYEMHGDGVKISVSLGTVEVRRVGGGTRLTYTEQAAFLDGYDDAGSRRAGTEAHLDRLAAVLAAVDEDTRSGM